MGLLTTLFSRSSPVEGAAAEPNSADSLTQARTRARQRLIGAVVLVGIGIIGFPILFENQPRPIPVNVPIEIPRKDNAPALNLPVARAPAIITETAAEAGLVAPAPKTEPKAAPKPDTEPKAASRPEPKPEPKVEPKPEPKVEPKPAPKVEPKPEPKVEPKVEPKAVAKPAAPATDAARAQALLEGKAGSTTASAPAPATRFIVQVGAFADAGQARETRLKVERLGLTTYTHVAETPQGSRTRVRVGPMPTRQEAEKVAARLKAAGLPSAILTL